MHSTERKIHSAFKKAASYCSEGLEPNKALANSAKEYDLNPDMTKRASEMLNIFLTHNFMKHAKDKTESFPLADCSEVLKLAFLEPEVKQDAKGPIVVNRKIASGRRDFLDFGRGKAVAAPRELSDITDKLQGCIKEAALEAQSKRAQLDEAYGKSFDSYRRLIDQLSFTENLAKFAEFERQIVSEYGDEARGHLDKIAEYFPNPKRLGINTQVKTASYFKRTNLHDLFDSYVSGLNKIAELQAEFRATSLKEAGMREEFNQACGIKAPIEDATSLLDFSKKAGVMSDLMSSVTKGLGHVLPVQEISNAKKDLYVDAHKKVLEHSHKYPKEQADMEMQNVKRQAILQDLMANDEIIAGQDPTKLEGAYNAVLHLSPEITLNREVMRSVLRNATAQQAVDPFTAKQLVDVQTSAMKNQGKLPTDK